MMSMVESKLTVAPSRRMTAMLLPPGPPEQLLLLPVLASFTFVFDLVISLFFYRRKDQRMVAYLISASSVITPILLIIATLTLV